VAVFSEGADAPERVIAAGREAAVDEAAGVTGAAAALSRTLRERLERLSDLTYVSLAPAAEARQVKVGIRVEPVTAEILLDGKPVGYGDYAGIHEAGTPLNLTLKKNGYREQSFTLTPKRGDNRAYFFKLDLDDPDQGAGLPDRNEEYELRIQKLEGDYQKALAEKKALVKEREALKKDLAAEEREKQRLAAELEDAQRKIREALDKLQ
jgi:signal transduction histidine kinase